MSSPALGPDELLELARSSVVRIRNTGCGQLSTGSGWMSPDREIVSNRHVVEGFRTLEVLTWDGRDALADGARISRYHDIGVLSGPWSAVPDLRPLPVRTDRVQPGERLALIGYPEGEQLEVVTGSATGYSADSDLAVSEVLKTTAIVRPGNSGGPVLDDRGRVVGVVFAELLASDEALIIPWHTVAAIAEEDLLVEDPCS